MQEKERVHIQKVHIHKEEGHPNGVALLSLVIQHGFHVEEVDAESTSPFSAHWLAWALPYSVFQLSTKAFCTSSQLPLPCA